MLEGLLVKAIKTFLDSKPSSTLRTLVAKRYYFGQAPANVDDPYVVFSIMAPGPDFYQGGLQIEELQVQFSIFATNASAASVLEAGAALCALFDDTKEIAISGYTLLLFERSSTICVPPEPEDEQPEQQYVALYRVKFYK